MVVLSKKREKELAGSINGLRQQISELQTSGIKISGLDEISSLRDQIIGLRNDLKSWHRKDDDNKPDSEQIKSAL